MGVAVEANRIGAKIPPILQPDKKEHSPPSTKNSSQRELYWVPDVPPNANQEYVGVG